MAKKNHELSNEVFERFVKDKKDVIAMIAYCFYRLEKLDHFKKNPGLSQQAQDSVCKNFIAGNHLERFKNDARTALSTSIDNAVAKTVRNIQPKGFWRSLFENVGFGILVAFLTPFVWIGLFHILKENDLWRPFVQWVNAISRTQ